MQSEQVYWVFTVTVDQMDKFGVKVDLRLCSLG